MKKLFRLFFVFSFLALALSLSAQRPNKTMRDSVFAVNDIVAIPVIDYEEWKPGLMATDSLRILANFITRHPNILFEIQVHSDYRGTALSNIELTAHRAKNLKALLCEQFQVDSNKIRAKGFGEKQVLFTENDILKVKSKQEQELMHLRNRRTVLRVLVADCNAQLDSVRSLYQNKLQQLHYKTFNEKEYKEGDKIKLPAIRFELGKANLRPEAADSLNLVATFLKTHQNLVVEIGQFADNHWPLAGSSHLMAYRAHSCAEYLIREKGIPRQNAIEKGYGATHLLFTAKEVSAWESKDAQDLAESFNRRTELKIVYVFDSESHKLNEGDKNYTLFKTQRKLTEDVIIPGLQSLQAGYGDSIQTWDACHYVLDELADFLNVNPRLRIELKVFRDPAGTAKGVNSGNVAALLIYNYLVKKKGVAPGQVVPAPSQFCEGMQRREECINYQKQKDAVFRILCLDPPKSSH